MQAPDFYGYAAPKRSRSFRVTIKRLDTDVVLYKRRDGNKVRDCALPRQCVIGEWTREYGVGFVERQKLAFDKLGAELVKM
jgi:hypothetical protein